MADLKTLNLNNVPTLVGDSGSGGTKGLVPAPAPGDSAAGKFLKADGTFAVPAGTATGNVVGPASSTDTAIARFDGTTGKLLKDTAPVTIDDNGLVVQTVSGSGTATAITQSITNSGGQPTFGIDTTVTNSASSTTASPIGMRITSIKSGANNADAYGLSSGIQHNGTGTTHVGYGVRVLAPVQGSSGTFASYYGLYTEEAPVGLTTTNNHALHVNTGISFFGGSILANTLTASSFVFTDTSKNLVSQTATQATAALNTFTTSLQGLVPASGGGTTNFLRADGTFAAPAGTGTVTSVALSVPATSILGVTGSPITTSGTLGLTTTGTSGGVPYFSSTSQLTSSSLLTASAIVLGGGAGASPTVLASLGTTSTVLHGNAAGAPTFGSIVNADIAAATIDLTAKVTGTLPIANGGTNSTATATAGGVGYGTGTAHAYTGAGTSGDWLISNGASAPSFSSTTTTGKTITGSADVNQMKVTGNATQTNVIFRVEKSDNTALLLVNNTTGTAIKGTTTNDDATATFVGEYVKASVTTNTNFPSSGTTGDITSISLTAGDWDLTGCANITANGSTFTSGFLGISSTSGNSTTGLVFGDNALDYLPYASGHDSGQCVPNVRVSISATTTYYLKTRCSYTVATPQYIGRLSARRIR